MSRSTAVLLALAITVTACGKNEEPVVAATPQQRGDPGVNQDSIDTVTRARELEAAEAAAAAERARLEAERAILVNQVALAINFDYDQFSVRSVDEANMGRKAALMRSNPALRIRVVGHADERGSDEYNLVLAMRRATSAKDWLVRMGVESNRIETASLGEEVPLDPSANESAWATNRRDEFEVIAGAQTMVAPR
jgi:peptidoglycan-associated lipoprotein